MENNIEKTGVLEEQVGAIIEKYRQEAYLLIADRMWTAFEEAGLCIIEDDFLELMTKHSVNGISTATLCAVCKAIQKGEDLRESDARQTKAYMAEFIKSRSLQFEGLRLKYPNYLKPWSKEDVNELERLWCEGSPIKDIATALKRNEGAIKSRVEKMELVQKYGEREIDLVPERN